MPNWAYNTLTIKGDKDTLVKIKKNLAGDEGILDFNNVIRMPESLRVTAGGSNYYDNIAHYGYENWYKWCIDMWDTKWNACDTRLTTDNDNELVYWFQTAWSGPWNIADGISRQYKNVEVNMTTTYEEPAGEDDVTYKNGSIIKAVKHPTCWRVYGEEFDEYDDAIDRAKELSRKEDEDEPDLMVEDSICYDKDAEIPLDISRWHPPVDFTPYLVAVE